METQLWRKILAPYRLAVDELVVKFTHIKQQYQDSRSIHQSKWSVVV